MMTPIQAHERSTRLAASFVRVCIGRVQQRWMGGVLAACVGLTAHPCAAYDVMLRWTVPSNSGVSGYRVYTGSASANYDQRTDVGQLAGSTLNGVVYYLYQGVPQGSGVYVAVTAYNANLESNYSNEKVLSQTTGTPPVVDAGLDQSATVGTSVILGSSATAGVSYFWQQVGGPPVTLSSRTSSNPRLTAGPAGTFTFTVTAYDTQGVAARDSVNVTVVGTGTATPTPRSTATPTGREGAPTPTAQRGGATSTPGSEARTPTPGTVAALIRGNRRSPKTNRLGCQVEWLVSDVHHEIDRFGLPSQNQTCTDNDPSCDSSSEKTGVCGFQVRVCLNNRDGTLPACTQNGIAALTVLAPRQRPESTKDADAILAADLNALQNALNHLRDPDNPGDGFVYAPPLEPAQQGFCSAPFAVKGLATSHSRRPSVTLKVRSADNGFPRPHLSVSTLQLTCLAAGE